MTYAVAYLLDGSRIGSIPFRCPIYSRHLFEEKKLLGLPCALMKHDGNQVVLIDSYLYEVLEMSIKA